MSWFRLDDKAAFHSKMVTAGNEVCGAVWRAGAWCSEHNRSGFVPRAVAHLIASPKVWHRAIAAGMVDVSESGYRIHDFNDYNPTDEQAAALREKKQMAGRVGGLRSGETRSKNEAPASSTIEAPASAPASTSAIPESKQTRSRTHPVPIPEEKIPPLPSVAAPVGANTSAGGPRQRRKPETAAPRLSEPVAAWAETWKLPTEHPEFSRFLSHHQAKESLFRDWAAAWRTWLGNAEKYAANGARSGRIVQRDPPGIVREIGWFDPEDAAHAQTGS